MSYLFKVLSGPLNGVEFSLGAQAYCICVGDGGGESGRAEFARSLAAAERTLYLPAQPPHDNFIVHLDQETEDGLFAVTVCHAEQHEQTVYAYNQVCTVGTVRFALKREGEAWSEDVVRGTVSDPVLADVLLSVPPREFAPQDHKGWRVARSMLMRVGVLALLVVLIAASAWWIYSAPARKALTLEAILSGSHTGYVVQQGRDQVYTIFARNERDASWARQALVRHRFSGQWQVVTQQQESERISELLEREGVAFFTVRFNNPRVPIVVLSRTRMPTDGPMQERVKRLVLAALPYAKQMQLEVYDDQTVVDIAQDGLTRLGLSYRAVKSDKGLVLLSSIYAGDARLAELKQLIETYYQNWGKGYVHFSAELRDDWLKDKSFKYGQDGYINMTRSHWLFMDGVK